MADNVTIPASGTGTATPVVATDDVSGVHYQRVKLDVGGDGVALPVVQVDGFGVVPVVVTNGGVVNTTSNPIEAHLVLSGGGDVDDGTGLLVNLAAGSTVNQVETVPVVSSTATLANVAASASSVTLQASNVNRLGLIIVNDSTVNLYVKFGSSASATSFTYKLGAGGILEIGPTGIRYTNIVTGIWDSATGSARMTELT